MTHAFEQAPFDALKERLAPLISANRFAHTVRVSETALALARQLHLSSDDCGRAETAGLLHDAAKEQTPQTLSARLGVPLSMCLPELWETYPTVWHAYVAPLAVARIFGVQDKTIGEAMRDHTTGSDTMSPVAKVVFVADFVEPGRTLPFVGWLRTLAGEDLDGAVYGISAFTIRNLIDRQLQIHPATLACYNAILKAVSPSQRQAILEQLETS